MSKTVAALPAIRTVGNYHLFPKNYEKTNKPSLTIPDQSMTVREIVTRFAKGLPITGNANPPLYEGEDTILPPNFKTLDMVEQRQIIQDLKKRVTETQSALAKKQKDEQTAKRKAEYQKAVEKGVNDALKAKNEPLSTNTP